MNTTTPNVKPDKSLMDHFKKREVQDFSYLILFLVVSSFFAFFVIKPVLSIAVALNKEGEDLERINKVYEENISKVLQLQADLELVRPKTYLLNDALPNNPKLDVLISDIRKVAQAENIVLEGVSIEGLEIKSKKTAIAEVPGQLSGVKIDLGISGNYEDAVRFIKALSQQRRIKTIQSVDIGLDKDPKASSSASPAFVKVKMNVQAYYL
ncbi:type 4a pilus biogenesis protein PilO [Candidatus Woesebacteria bacterium]|nr:type 4a pilus biogenesis protein PilO [Candidatus Woesebacteria bacterium]